MPTAQQLLSRLGEALVGREVLTQPYGEWPGGIARVTQVAPDPAAPEIVFQVVMKGWEIGVFHFEPVELIRSKQGVQANLKRLRAAGYRSEWAGKGVLRVWRSPNGRLLSFHDALKEVHDAPASTRRP